MFTFTGFSPDFTRDKYNMYVISFFVEMDENENEKCGGDTGKETKHHPKAAYDVIDRPLPATRRDMIFRVW